MQVANRTTRRYITPSTKTSAGNIRPVAKKQSTIPSASHSSPKKIADAPVPQSKEQPTLKKLIDRFRYDEPQARPERDSISSEFWWLREELQKTCDTIGNDDEDDRDSNIPEFIEIFPSTDIDQDLNKRASLLLNQTFSAHSSDVGQVSSTGIGSTASTTMTTTTTASTFHPVVNEKPARPIFTRIHDSKFDLKSENGEDDILYQWRLRRRLEQAQNGEPITFPSKVANRSAIAPARPFFPTVPIEIPTVLPPTPPPPAPVLLNKPTSPQRERQQSSITNTEPEQMKPPVSATPIPIRQYSEMATQTLQDAAIQTSPIKEDYLPSSSNVVVNEADHRPTRDEEHRSSVWHRPPPRSKHELTHVSSSPSPIKRHHHRHHSFRPVATTEQPTVTDVSHHHHRHPRSIVYPSITVQSSQDSTLTQVTAILVSDQNSQSRDHHHHLDLIERSHEQVFLNEDDDPVDYSNDEILNMLIQKRDELLMTFREIEQRLTQMIVQ